LLKKDKAMAEMPGLADTHRQYLAAIQ